MATKQTFQTTSIRITNPHFSSLKNIIETAFYRNNVVHITSLKEAYQLAYENPNTIILDKKIAHALDLGLDEDTCILVDNCGKTAGRNAKARRILTQNKEEDTKLNPIIREALYQGATRKFYSAQAIVGLDEDFMIKAHLCINEGQESNLYSWLLNFQILNDVYQDRYHHSKQLDDNDIYVYVDSEWTHPDYPNGLSYFDTLHNAVIILGMRYFGELKKGTLTLAWATAYRNNYVACHGGLKSFKDAKYVASFFGLSGSGKSTLTHSKHGNRFNVEVLHDDAFIINVDDGSSIALEPAYFDKTQDYPAGDPEQDYFLTVQNVGVTLNEDNQRVLVTQDITNGNGRTVKSRYSTSNRTDKVNEPINAIYWIMKDDSLPPLVKINDPILASVFGLTLATKRTTAEAGVIDPNALVIEPYANPFRVYSLVDDYTRFKELFMKGSVECFVINTGHYLDKKIPKETTLSLIENEVTKTNNFKAFLNQDLLSYCEIDNFQVVDTFQYRELVKKRLQIRVDFINNYNLNNPKQPLPQETLTGLLDLIKAI